MYRFLQLRYYYSANSISELTNDKIQEIIDSFTEQESHHMMQKDKSSTPEISAGGPCHLCDKDHKKENS